MVGVCGPDANTLLLLSGDNLGYSFSPPTTFSSPFFVDKPYFSSSSFDSSPLVALLETFLVLVPHLFYFRALFLSSLFLMNIVKKVRFLFFLFTNALQPRSHLPDALTISS